MTGGCQQGYLRQTINMICDNKEQCRMEYRWEMLFNNLNKELCIQIKHDNKTIGGIRIKKE
uniref:Phlebovirus_G2 domain-containing protein n=1 Tax=Heterorhabditis bacteriophora TaxID=37862 RepID=A0A1I7XEQ0_HETBA